MKSVGALVMLVVWVACATHNETVGYLKDADQLVSAQSCRRLKIEELKRELELWGGPPHAFAELHLPKDRAR